MNNSTYPINRRRFLAGMGAVGAGAIASGSMLATLKSALASTMIGAGKDDVLLVIDVQNCFLPGGTLPVSDGDQIIPIINKLGQKFKNVVFTQDWHTPGHESFASSHDGKAPFDTVEMDYGTQVLWPDHCVQGTEDAKLAAGLDIPHAQLIVRKGYNSAVDSYSAFVAADGKTKTGLTGYMKERGLQNVYMCGLATDFCVNWSAQDGRKAGLNVAVIEDACRAIDLNGSLQAAWDAMKASGVKRMQSSEILSS
ncbi:nicotinamidase [Thalassospira lucentensis]|uniref:nicotinamidase n=1 Tax=Thalassospira lucentensis TaxID=168935 RepID=UPI003AA7DD1F